MPRPWAGLSTAFHGNFLTCLRQTNQQFMKDMKGMTTVSSRFDEIRRYTEGALPDEYATTIKYDGGFVLVPRMGLGYSQAPGEKKSQHTRSVGVTIRTSWNARNKQQPNCNTP